MSETFPILCQLLLSSFILSLSTVSPMFASQPKGKTINPQNALNVIKTLEKGVVSFSWHGTFELGSINSNGESEPEHYAFQLLWSVEDNRYSAKVRFEIGDQCVGNIFTHDGNRFESLEGAFPDDTDYAIRNGRGIITKDAGISSTQERFFQTGGTPVIGIASGIPGICDFTPEYNPKFLSSYLAEWIENKQVLSITETEPGIWHIISKVTIWTLPGENNPRTRIEIQYDINKGGIITMQKVIAQRLDKDSGAIADIVVMDWKMTHKLNAANQYVPDTIESTDQSILSYYKLSFEKFEINPTFSDDSFHIEFPDGTYVDDFISKMRYKVGDLIDEDLAIETFMRAHNLTGDVPTKFSRSGVVRMFFMLTGLALMGIAIFQLMRKKKTRSNPRDV